jgi:hypothetical protein
MLNAAPATGELMSRPGARGEFRCLPRNQLLEVFDGSHQVAIRLAVQPAKGRHESSGLARASKRPGKSAHSKIQLHPACADGFTNAHRPQSGHGELPAF